MRVCGLLCWLVVFVLLVCRSHSISFTIAQGIPKFGWAVSRVRQDFGGRCHLPREVPLMACPRPGLLSDRCSLPRLQRNWVTQVWCTQECALNFPLFVLSGECCAYASHCLRSCTVWPAYLFRCWCANPGMCARLMSVSPYPCV